jgi:urea transport system permease protein
MTRLFARLVTNKAWPSLALFMMGATLMPNSAQAESIEPPQAAMDTVVGANLNVAMSATSTATYFDSLMHSVEGKSDALMHLIASEDTSFYPLFINLFQGNVYFYPADTALPHRLVITGPEVEIDGETRYPLSSAWPFAPILDAVGSAKVLPTDSLLEFEVDRSMRSMLQPVLTAMDLRNPLRQKRRNAAMSLGESGDTLVIPMLRHAADVEGDRITKHLMLEAASRLELHAQDPARQLAAAQNLAKMHGTNALAEIKVKAAGPAPAGAAAGWNKGMTEAVDALDSWMSVANSVQAIFTGVSLGSILILMALGLAIIFGLMGVINMAHGEFMMVGAYATFVTQNLFVRHLPEQSGWFLAFSFPVAFLVAGGVGMLVEWLVIRRLYGRPLETLLATWGLSLVLIQGARHIFGDLTAVTMPAWLGGGFEVMPQVTFPFNRVFIMGLTVVIVLGMTALFYGTRVGLKIRAVTQNRSMSSCLGVRTRRVDGLTFGLGTGIAGIAGCALTQIGNVDPGMGQNYIVDSFLVVVTGGVGKLMGTVLAGLSIGALNKFIEPSLQAVYAKVALLGLVILFLQVRPSGLFPAKGRNEDL